MSADLPDRVAAICSDAVSELLLSVTNGNDALAVSIPG